MLITQLGCTKFIQKSDISQAIKEVVFFTDQIEKFQRYFSGTLDLFGLLLVVVIFTKCTTLMDFEVSNNHDWNPCSKVTDFRID